MIAGLVRTRARRWVLLAVAALVVAAIAVAVWPRAAGAITSQDEKITVPAGPGLTGTVTLDAGLYLPAHTPAPAVIVAHGFGQTRFSVDADAQRLARAGFVVLTYSARGFGASTGRIGLDSLDYEVPDARALVSWLGRQREVIRDGPDDPRVGVTGGSYGGALALMLAGTDHRVDAVAAVATWNDLQQALFPNNAAPVDADRPTAVDGVAPPAATPADIPPRPDGVFKQAWTAALISSVLTPTPGAAQQRTCGRLMPAICSAYTQVAETGRITPAMQRLLANSSPARVVSHITAPTLLVQGGQDTLFGLDQADANARAIAANGTPVAVSWYAGGHNGGPPDIATENRITDWLHHYLMRTGPAPSTAFRYSVAGPVSDRGEPRLRTLQVPGYPGLPAPSGSTSGAATPIDRVPLRGAPQVVANPAGGVPAALTSLPGVSGLASSLSALATLPGQTAEFLSQPLDRSLVVTGSASVTLSIARVPPGRPAGATTGAAEGGAAAGTDAGSAVLYLSLASVPPASGAQASAGAAPSSSQAPAGTEFAAGGAPAALGAAPAGGAVAPIRLDGLPVDGTPANVTVDLPAVAFQVVAGNRLMLRVATTDQGYFGPKTPALYRVSLVGGDVLAVPAAGGTRLAGDDAEPVGLAIALGALVLAGLAALVWVGSGRRRRPRPGPAADDADPSNDGAGGATAPLVISGLAKRYPGDVIAVQDVSLRVERGQVLGLLGPNGAGKTTTLRMVMGLIMPSAGDITIFGEPAGPGAPVLSRIGSFVEGAGFLPHLSGAANLNLYWRATGRPAADAHLIEALEIADLGTAIRRKVKTYSQGMRQRLAIAQAMLGLPDLLILDEPTNGLDPPQIHAMREVLRRYAATGRTVLISSHLLSEVEQTCSHVVVMSRGRTIAAGTVAAMVAASGEISIATPTPDAAAAALTGLDGIGDIERSVGGIAVDLAACPLGEVLRRLLDAGVVITAAAPRNRLEDVFLELVGSAEPVSAAARRPNAAASAPPAREETR